MSKKLFFLLFFLLVFEKVFSFSDTSVIKSHLTKITKTIGYRTYNNVELLDKTADYIESVFKLYSDSVTIQNYIANGRNYKNVICSFGTMNKKRIIVGAHYDVCGNQEGADDNASGVCGLLELARLLSKQNLNYRIDLVAFSLEEPPFFRTESMGSYIHAESLIKNKREVLGMISLEMIGFFNDKKKSQQYPLGVLSSIYGNRGDYITLINKVKVGKFSRKFNRLFVSTHLIKTKKFKAPKFLTGIDFSDHLNYWHFGIGALMITDTSFFRNKNYHQSTDTMETLDIARLGKVIDAVFLTLLQFK